MKKAIVAVLLGVVSCVNISLADDKAASEPEEKVVTGEVASSARVAQGQSTAVDLATDAPGDAASVIAASVFPSRSGKCRAVVKNNSPKNSYSVSYFVVGKDKSGSEAFKKSYSDTLKPGASKEKEIGGCSSDLSLQVVIKSGRKL